MEYLSDRETALYFKVYQKAFRSGVLCSTDKNVLFTIKSFAPIGQAEMQAFPSIETIAKYAMVSEKTVRESIKRLVAKGFLIKIRRGQGKTNLYIINDRPELWDDNKTDEERKELAKVEKKTKSELIEELSIEELERILAEKKQKASQTALEPHTEPTSPQVEEIPTTTEEEPQKAVYDEVYKAEEILDVEQMKESYPKLADHIDNAIFIINDVVNTQSDKPIELRQGEKKPLEVVKSVLMKLNEIQILAAIERTLQVKNITSYDNLLRSNLYSAGLCNTAQFLRLQEEIRKRYKKE